MKRASLMVLALGCMVGISALALQTDPAVSDPNTWFSKAQPAAATTAILLELGVSDESAQDWSGQATVEGAKIVRREGYRFRKGDTLTTDDAWKASSHRPIRAGRNPRHSQAGTDRQRRYRFSSAGRASQRETDRQT